MNDTASKLSKLLETKAAIKQAIIDKGVEVPDGTTFDEYPNKIAAIEGGGSGPDYIALRTSNHTNYGYLFTNYAGDSLEPFALENWDTSNVTTMKYMFNICKAKNYNLGNWDFSKVTDTSNMFSYSDAVNIDLSSWTVNPELARYNMGQMFVGCDELETLDIRNLNIAISATTGNAFYNCNKLHTLRLDNCPNDTINKIITSTGFPTGTIEGVTRKIYCKESEAAGLTAPTNWVFEYVEEPIPLYVSGQFSNKDDITEVRTMVNDTHTDLANMFNSCINLTTINTADWDTSNVTNMNYMFNYCHKLITLDLSNFDTSNVTSMYAMFNYCSNLEEVDLRNFDMTNTTNVNIMFGSCYELRTLRLDNCSNTTIGKIITSTNFPAYAIEEVTRKIYCKQENITGLTAPNGWVFVDYMTGEEIVPEMPEEPDVPDVPLYVSGQFSNKSDITEVRTMVNSTHTSLGNMFSYCFNLASIIGIEYWDTSNVTNMGRMFTYCAKLITLDLSSFDTSKVTDMEWMFMNCSNLTTVDLSNFDMTNVTNASSMFGYCYELHTLRLDNCSNATISKIVTSASLPTGTVNGTTRKIYCKEANASGLTAPNGWEFIFVE